MFPRLVRPSGRVLKSTNVGLLRIQPSFHWTRTILPVVASVSPQPLVSVSSFTSNASDPPKTRADRLVDFLNGAITEYPREAIGCLIATEILSVFACHKALLLAGVAVPTEFALAFALSRPLRRFRLPLEIGAAAVLSFYFPSLTRIKVTALSAALPSPVRSEFTRKDSYLKAGAEKLGQVIDKFGLSYFIAARWVGVSIVLSLYGGICYGMDVTSFVERTFGALGADIGGVLGSWAAAVVLTSTVYPFSILMGAGLAKGIGSLRKVR